MTLSKKRSTHHNVEHSFRGRSVVRNLIIKTRQDLPFEVSEMSEVAISGALKGNVGLLREMRIMKAKGECIVTSRGIQRLIRRAYGIRSVTY